MSALRTNKGSLSAEIRWYHEEFSFVLSEEENSFILLEDL